MNNITAKFEKTSPEILIKWRCPKCKTPQFEPYDELDSFVYMCHNCMEEYLVTTPAESTILSGCDHGDDKQSVLLTAFMDDIYLCECGALINCSDPRNFQEPYIPMTAKEINCAVIRTAKKMADDVTKDLTHYANTTANAWIGRYLK